jgi:hypothetical protein
MTDCANPHLADVFLRMIRAEKDLDCARDALWIAGRAGDDHAYRQAASWLERAMATLKAARAEYDALLMEMTANG